MKRILVAILSIIILLGFTTTTNVLAKENTKIVINVDGKSMELDKVNVNVDGKMVETDVPAVIYGGNTLVPVRFVSEQLGAKVEWDNESRSATIKTQYNVIKIKENSSKAIINGKEQDMPNNAMVKLISTSSSESSRTVVPLRFVSEILGSKVEWVRETRTANISSVKDEPEIPMEPDKEEEKLNKIKSITTKNIDNSRVPQIYIEAENEINYKNISNSTESSVVIDIEDAVIDKELSIDVNDNIIKSIKARQKTDKNKKIVSVTIQLNKAVKNEVIKDKNILNINFINEIQAIEKQVIDGKEAIVIRNVCASKANSFQLTDPERLVVDLRNTNLNNIGGSISTDIIKQLRVGQYTGKEYDPTEQVARVVLDISEDYENPKFAIEERGDDIIIFVEGNKKQVIVPPVVIPPSNSNSNNNTNQKVIVIDPGHGGSKPGSVYNGIIEKDVALRASLKTREQLELLGYKVLMTRTDDTNPSFSNRYNLANNNNADAFLSIHFNAVDGIPTATGIETLYGTKNSQNKAFAQSIQDELIVNTGARNRGLKLRNDLAVLNGTKGISALAELGFISNPKDAKEIVTESYMEKCAIAIANGIHKFFTT